MGEKGKKKGCKGGLWREVTSPELGPNVPSSEYGSLPVHSMLLLISMVLSNISMLISTLSPFSQRCLNGLNGLIRTLIRK